MRRRKLFRKLKRESTLLPGYIIVTLWVLFTVWMLIWLICASLSKTPEIFTGEVGRFSSGIHFENYVKVWENQNVGIILKNSLIYSMLSAALIILISAPAAYALSRYTFWGRNFFKASLATAMGLPVVTIVLPLFCLSAKLGMIDNGIKNQIVLVFLYIGINVPYSTIFLLSFFSNLAHDYEEAAAIDGCSQVKAFWKVMFPLAQPGIITVMIFNILNVWGEYFVTVIFANSEKIRNVSVGLYSMINSMRYSGDWAALFAAVAIITLPTVVFYIFLSEKIITGVTMGGIKG